MSFDTEPVERVEKPDKVGLVGEPGVLGKEALEVFHYKPPTGARKKVMSRVFQMCLWVEKKGWVEKEEVVVYAMNRWDVERRTALEYTDEVVELMNRQGRVRG